MSFTEYIDRSYRDVIAKRVAISDLMKHHEYAQKNEEESWEYRRYPEIDPNFICVSKDGTLGEIWKVGDLIIGIPSSKGKEILNLNESNRHKRVWNRTKIPQDFKKLDIDYKRNMRKIKGMRRNDIKLKYVADRKELMEKHKDHVDQEFHRRKHGLFIKIDDQICWISGQNYMFLNYYYLAEDKIYPKFRITAMHTWWHWEGVCADNKTWGELRLKSRRVSWTSEACSIALDKMTITKYAEIPIVSENDRLAKILFTKKIVNPFSYYPAFFKPIMDDPNDKPKSQLEIIFETDYQETSEISFYPTKDVAYDSTKATFGINDEVGKYVNVEFTTFRGNHKDCYFQGLTKIVGKGKFGSTAGEFSIGGESFSYEFEQANALKRNKFGETPTGLISLFVDDCYTSAGFFDKWGFPIVHDPKEPIEGEYGDWVEFGSITVWNSQYEKLSQGKKSDLNNYLRQHPRKVEHAFRDESGANNDFNINHLNDHDEFLSNIDEEEMKKIIHRGNLTWKGEPYKSDVMWVPNPEGRFFTTWIPPKELQNQNSKKPFHGLRFEGENLNMPDNNHIGALAVDSYDISQTVDGVGSKGAMVGMTKHNMAGAPNRSFFLKYLERPDKRDDFYDDVIMACQFWGMYALIESNKPRLLEYMKDKGFRGFVMTRPDKKWKDLSDFEKECGGIPSSAQLNEDVANLLKDFIMDFIGINLDKDVHCWFIDMIKEFKKFNIKKRKKFDLTVACQLALMAIQYKVKMRKTVNINTQESESLSLSNFGA